jgi:hypothetical protein
LPGSVLASPRESRGATPHSTVTVDNDDEGAWQFIYVPHWINALLCDSGVCGFLSGGIHGASNAAASFPGLEASPPVAPVAWNCMTAEFRV